MWEFCLISALGDNENLQALEKINIVTPTSNLSDDAKFTILDFRVGALDSCVGFSDELGKVNTFAQSLIKRMDQRLCCQSSGLDCASTARGAVLMRVWGTEISLVRPGVGQKIKEKKNSENGPE